MPIRTTFRHALRATLVASSATLWLAGCAQKPATADAPPPSVLQSSTGALSPADMQRTAPAAPHWAGTYQAVLPCPDCPGTAIRVQLRPDMTAAVLERRLGTPAEQGAAPTYQGPLRVEQSMQARWVILGQPQEQAPAYRLFIGDGWVELRDRATGAPLGSGTQYRLRRTNLH